MSRTTARRWTDVVVGLATGCVVAALVRVVDSLTDPGLGIATANARALLAASFTATVTAGAFAFWMLPLAAQLAASSVPPPTVSARLHDPFQRRIILLTVCALTYTGLVLLTLPSDGTAGAPTASTILGALLGIGAIASLLVAIRHAERTTRPSVLVSESAQEVIAAIRRARDHTGSGEIVPRSDAADDEPLEITAPATGWLRAVDEDGLVRSIPRGCTARLQVGLGAFVVRDWTVVAVLHDGDADDRDRLRTLPQHFHIGNERASETDLVGALSRFTDITVHAAIGGSGAPSTVYETIWYLGAILHELVDHDTTVSARRFEGDRIVEPQGDPSAAELTVLAVDRIRQVTASQPAMALELVRVLVDACKAAHSSKRSDIEEVLHHQADLVVEQSGNSDALPIDIARVRDARNDLAPEMSAGRRDEYPTRSSSEEGRWRDRGRGEARDRQTSTRARETQGVDARVSR